MTQPADSLGFDQVRCAAIITRALQLPGGTELVIGSLTGLPGAVVPKRRTGRFGGGGEAPSVQIGEWRYQAGEPGRLSVAQVSNGMVRGEHEVLPPQAGGHVAMALRQHLTAMGPRILPDVLGLEEGLRVAIDET